jgi:ACDE family multidrug resistance protein
MSSRFIGVAAGPPVMSLVMKNHINMTYIISGIIGIGIVLIVMKFISSDKKEAAA